MFVDRSGDMSKKKNELIEILSQHFWGYKSYELEGVLTGYGIFPDETLNPNDSKKAYARSGLVKMKEEEIVELSKKIAKEAEDVTFNKQMEEYLGDEIFEFSYVTRRKLAEYLSECPNFAGKMKLDELLNSIWNMNEFCTRDEVTFIFDPMTLGEYIVNHVVTNGDISYKDMLLDILQFKYISDNSLIKFLEKMVNPEVRTGEEQIQYVKGINSIINADGFELVITGKISNEPIYKISKQRKISGNIKNLIFAPMGKKPDIVIDDAIANDIKIIGDMDNCLLYNFEPNADGLMWNTLVKWWENIHPSSNIQQDLFKRLLNSLDSQPEKDFFTQYYKIYQSVNEYPALIPQVYLHYDPHAKTWRGNNVVYTHQRMDFLMLLPRGVRVVIEIDGKQHYSEGNISSPKLYAEMVADTRKLQLKGYEVYRFGGYEFCGNSKIKEMVQSFFDTLFEKYSIEIKTCKSNVENIE